MSAKMPFIQEKSAHFVFVTHKAHDRSNIALYFNKIFNALFSTDTSDTSKKEKRTLLLKRFQELKNKETMNLTTPETKTKVTLSLYKMKEQELTGETKQLTEKNNNEIKQLFNQNPQAVRVLWIESNVGDSGGDTCTCTNLIKWALEQGICVIYFNNTEKSTQDTENNCREHAIHTNSVLLEARSITPDNINDILYRKKVGTVKETASSSSSHPAPLDIVNAEIQPTTIEEATSSNQSPAPAAHTTPNSKTFSSKEEDVTLSPQGQKKQKPILDKTLELWNRCFGCLSSRRKDNKKATHKITVNSDNDDGENFSGVMAETTTQQPKESTNELKNLAQPTANALQGLINPNSNSNHTLSIQLSNDKKNKDKAPRR